MSTAIEARHAHRYKTHRSYERERADLNWSLRAPSEWTSFDLTIFHSLALAATIQAFLHPRARCDPCRSKLNSHDLPPLFLHDPQPLRDFLQISVTKRLVA